MKTAYDYLIEEVGPEEITKITLGEIEIEKEATFELMKKIDIEYVFNDIVFWTKDSMINKITDYSDYECGEVRFKERKLKPNTKIKVTPESLKELWKDPETGMHLPAKTKTYIEEEKGKEEIETFTLIETDTTLVIDL